MRASVSAPRPALVCEDAAMSMGSKAKAASTGSKGKKGKKGKNGAPAAAKVTRDSELSGKAAKPTDIRAVSSSMYPHLDEAAIKAVGDMVMSSSCGKARYRLKLSFQLQQ